MCQLSGSAPTKKSVEAVLKAGGVSVDKSRLDALFAEFEGKDFDEIVKTGMGKLVGGAGSAAAPAAAAGAAPAKAAAAPVEESEDDDDMGGLF
eukprot:125874_1